VTRAAVAAFAALLEDPEARSDVADHNLRVAREHFGLSTLRRLLLGELKALDLPAGRQ
jgi:hypothetical protein